MFEYYKTKDQIDMYLQGAQKTWEFNDDLYGVFDPRGSFLWTQKSYKVSQIIFKQRNLFVLRFWFLQNRPTEISRYIFQKKN